MKYIIEFEDEPSMVEAGLRYYQCKQVPYWGVSYGIIKNLTPYTQKEEIHVGDEVEYIDGNTNAFVSYFDGEMCDLICADGSVAEDICLNMLRPTGRKCPEVLKLLETLQREYDDQ